MEGNYKKHRHGDAIVYEPRKQRWTVTSIDISAWVDKANIDSLREVYAHGVKFVRESK